MAATPIVKWVGGKTKLLPELRARLPKTWNRYYEPFAGGASLFFSLEPERSVLADMNDALIATYQAVANDVFSIIDRLTAYKQKNLANPLFYYETRTRWNAKGWESTADHAAMFIYMNKTCYNGLWRVNRKGGFNVPKGSYVNPSIFDAEELKAASLVLQKTSLLAMDYEATIRHAEAGDFVYFDPPYDPVSKTSNFTAYTKHGFGKQHQELLASTAARLVKRGVSVMLSNHDTPFIRSLYTGFRIDTVQCPRAINSKGDKRDAVDEVIICGGYG